MTKQSRKRERDLLELVDEPVVGEPPRGTDRPHVESVESFEDFYRREYRRLLVLARALAGDAAAEDVAQEAMIVTYREWSRISGLASPAGYVRGICAHQAVSLTRRVGAEGRALRRLAGRRVVTLEPLPSDSEHFWREVRRLPSRQARATALFYALDLPVAEVALTLGCAEGTVKVHLSRARTTLAGRLGSTEEPS